MSLDLIGVAAQVSGMVARLKADSQQRQEHLQTALDTLNAIKDPDHLKQKIARSRTTWLVAMPVTEPSRRFQPPAIPDDFSVLATDGSHIEVDRHRPARCYLINIGAVSLTYGARPDARLASLPQLYAGPEDTALAPEKARAQPVEGNLLALRRSVEECRHLTDLAGELSPDTPALALLDGSLILWGLEAYPEAIIDLLLERGFLPCLDKMRQLNDGRRLALASYISLPRGTDVVNALRVAICPHEAIDTDRLCKECPSQACDAVAGVQDGELFHHLLDDGERSALFQTQSSIVPKRYREHRIYFFYLRVGDEIARVEVPQWVAGDGPLLDLTHGLVRDQCQRGMGYPVALAEAHEQAVVTNANKEDFWRLVESLMAEAHMPAATSAKRFSKKTRWL